MKVCKFILKKTPTQGFSCEICEIFKKQLYWRTSANDWLLWSYFAKIVCAIIFVKKCCISSSFCRHQEITITNRPFNKQEKIHLLQENEATTDILRETLNFSKFQKQLFRRASVDNYNSVSPFFVVLPIRIIYVPHCLIFLLIIIKLGSL